MFSPFLGYNDSASHNAAQKDLKKDPIVFKICVSPGCLKDFKKIGGARHCGSTFSVGRANMYATYMSIANNEILLKYRSPFHMIPIQGARAFHENFRSI